MSIGWNLRKLRTEQGRTLEDVARAGGCSRSMLCKVENDCAVPSMATLVAIAKALGVEPSTLVCGDPAGGAVFEPAAHPRPEVIGGQGQLLRPVAAALAGKRMQPYLCSAERGQVSATPASHAGEVLVLILDGELLWRIGLVEYRMNPGDTLYFDARHEHCCTLVSERARWLLVTAATPDPGGADGNPSGP